MFVQNPFTADFLGNWVLGDRHQALEFRCMGNKGRGDESVQSFGIPPYDLSGNDADGNPNNEFNITLALNTGSFKNWFQITVDLTPGIGDTYVLNSMSVVDVVNKLNANSNFSAYFTASVVSNNIQIKQKRPITTVHFYINNGQAESVLNFNSKAGIAEIPSYFVRHTVGGTYRFDFEDGQNILVLLDESNGVDAEIITNAGFDPVSPKEDWELLKGRSGIFNFQKITVDGSDRITEIIEYPAGAKEGDLGRKTNYAYAGTNKNPDQITEIPYTLASGDFITP